LNDNTKRLPNQELKKEHDGDKSLGRNLKEETAPTPSTEVNWNEIFAKKVT